ncbi:MAG TPA: hypothetical protein PLO67_04555, partial [Saprospiraceae bacterium]|nr:hypothetical protein [Saprospiraceae bacterium]HPI05962.1 hypothetical protein [Saprospiraceae bacterium]
MNNELIYLNLFEWKRNGVFQLVLNLDLLKAGLVNAGLTSPEATIKPEDVITVSVYLPVDVLHQKVSIGGVDDTGTPLLNLADRNQNIGFSNMNNAAPGIYQVKTVLVRGTKTYEFENKLVVPEQICTPSVELKVSEFELTTS